MLSSLKLKQGVLVAASALLSLVAITPFAVGFPNELGPPGAKQDITPLLSGGVLLIALSMGVISALVSGRARMRIFISAAALAGTGLIASALLVLNSHLRVVEVPIPHIFGPLLSLDGGSAYEADEFEMYSEIWLLVAVPILVVTVLRLRGMRARATR